MIFATSARVIGLLACLALSTHVRAADIPMRFSAFSPCDGNGSMCASQVFAQGTIQADSADKLRDFWASKTAREMGITPRSTISFDSPGGSVAGAMALGKLIRQAGAATNVEREYSRVVVFNQQYEIFAKKAVCASACTLAFLGGTQRNVAADAAFGVHQFAAARGNIGDSATQFTVVELALYVESMGVDRRLLDYASLVPPSSMYWLASELARTLQVDNITPPLAPWEITATSEGLPNLVVRQRIAHGRQTAVSLTVRRGVVQVFAAAILSKGLVGADRINGFPEGEEPEIDLIVDRASFRGKPEGVWTKLSETRESTTFVAVATFPTSILQKLGNAKSLRVADNFPNAINDLSIATTLSTEKLSGGAMLLARSK